MKLRLLLAAGISAAGLAGITAIGSMTGTTAGPKSSAAAEYQTGAADVIGTAAIPAGKTGETITAGTDETLYCIGSTSKVFTAAAVMKLAEEGAVDLDAPLTDYITEFYMADARYQDITPRMLLDHSSGIQGGTLVNTMLYGDNDTYNHDTLLTLLKTQRLKAAPGEFSVYCNDGYTLAEILVERLSGQSFTNYLEQNFWEPMALKNIKTPQSIDENTNLAKIYYNGFTELPYEFVNVIGSGGIYATARDLSQAGQMFVSEPKKQFQILSETTVAAMQQPEFTPGYGMNPDIPSVMGYGLGWDSVESAAFSKYGIKALGKGGDTDSYHSMLTVLPELNISCSVLSSGGSSTFNSLIANEIILAYLEETGLIQIDNSSVVGLGTRQEIPSELYQYAGWYTGAGVYKMDFSNHNTLLVETVGTRRNTIQEYYYVGNHRFVSDGGGYIAANGELVSAQAGIRGTTELTFQDETAGVYLGFVTSEITPGLGETIVNLPLAEKISPIQVSDDVMAAWNERNNKEYLLISEKYTSSIYLENPSVRPVLYAGLPGYAGDLDWDSFTRITDADHSQFFQKLPGQFGRDLVDLEFRNQGGREYLYGRHDYIAAASVPELTGEDNVIRIAADGLTGWYYVGTGLAGAEVTIEAPSNGNYFIYTDVDDQMNCVASSLTGDGGNPLTLPEGARIAFAGESGAVFTIHVQDS